MHFVTKLFCKAATFTVGLAVGGPVVAIIASKAVSVATGNLIALIPFGGILKAAGDLITSGADIATDVLSITDLSDVHALTPYGGPEDTDIHGNIPHDIQGNDVGRTITGGRPTDIYGHPRPS